MRRKYLKPVISNFANVAINETERNARKLIKKFLSECGPATEMKKRMLDVYWKYVKIQKAMKVQLAVKFAKVEVLCFYWDKMISRITIKASKSKDKGVHKILQKMLLVPDKVKRAMLRHYVKHCRQLYSIAFL